MRFKFDKNEIKCYHLYDRRSKRHEKYRYLALYFAIILVIFTQFSSKKTRKKVNLDIKIEVFESVMKEEKKK